MSLSSVISLGGLRLLTQQRADLVNSPNITTPMWNSFLTNSYKELYDMLVAAYGNDYYIASPYTITMTANNLYPLPSDFYKLTGVDLQYSASPTGWVSLKRFEFLERNRFGYLTPAINSIAQTARAWYIPEPTSLEYILTCALTFNSAVVSLADVTPLSVGMSVSGTGIPASTTILSINTTLNQVTLSLPCTVTSPISTLLFWTDATTIDGISGWEEYVIVDSAIKALGIQESDTSLLERKLLSLKNRIEGMAEGRDAGQAHHVTDALCPNSWGYNQLGAASLRYRLLGSNLMLVPCADDNSMDSGGYGGGWY